MEDRLLLLLTATVCTCIGLLLGKWFESLRWRANAAVIFRIACGGRLYKVKDVTPWDPPPLFDGPPEGDCM